MRAVIRRLQPASADMLGAPTEAVALYVTDPRKPIETSQELLQRLFGLNQAGSRGPTCSGRRRRLA